MALYTIDSIRGTVRARKSTRIALSRSDARANLAG
jgi:hypothetical protein